MYETESDDASLYPNEGYGLVLMDGYKAPDDPDFINLITSWPTAEEVSIPNSGPNEDYFIHSADGEEWHERSWDSDQLS